MLKVAFFGLPLGALLLARDGHDIVIAGLCREAPGFRRARRVLGDERVVLRPDAGDPAFARRLQSLAPDVVVSWFWTKKLPKAVLATARLGGIGVHPSLLPRHRGPDPTCWAILSGDAETGVTVHRLDEEYDTGDVLAVERVAIDPSWDAWHLARVLNRPSLLKLRQTVSRLARGEQIVAAPQDDHLATYAPFLTDEERAIPWSEGVDGILRLVRALAPAPGAWTEIGGALVTIFRAEAASECPRALSPGEGAVVGGLAVVRAGDGAVTLLEGEILGDDDASAPRPAGPEDLAALFR